MRTFTPLGGHEPRRFSGRVIAATNRGLGELRHDRRLREDFFYRLCSNLIEVPPLRQRIGESAAELELLVRRLVARITGTEDDALAAQVLERLSGSLPRGYPWPGNVRELGTRPAHLPQAHQGVTGGRRSPESLSNT